MALSATTTAAIWWLAHSSFGYALRATRDHRRRAAASGLDVERVRWAAFTLSGALAGLAGTIYVFAKGSLSPDVLSIPRSVDALVMVLLGGVETLTGPLVGAFVFTWLQDWVARSVPYWQALLGTIIVTLTVVFPHGITGTVMRWRRRGEIR
ncbi:MAG: branched-chain amino acid ABC transporter permease [Hyphomicrobiaceae bacterium]